MILNERQYVATMKQIKLLQEGAARAKDSAPSLGLDPRIHAAMIEGLDGELKELRRQLRRYDNLKAGRTKARKLRGLSELPEALIEARIARGWTQKDLAQKLNVAEQQVQRYEQDRYEKTSLGRLLKVAQVLGASITPSEMRFARPTPAKANKGIRTASTQAAKSGSIRASRAASRKTSASNSAAAAAPGRPKR
jgi:HTH-type transcriptional regulator/antitoxin HigA